MKDCIIEALIVAFAIYFGLGQIADALENVQVDMKTVTIRVTDEAPGDGAP